MYFNTLLGVNIPSWSLHVFFFFFKKGVYVLYKRKSHQQINLFPIHKSPHIKKSYFKLSKKAMLDKVRVNG